MFSKSLIVYVIFFSTLTSLSQPSLFNQSFDETTDFGLSQKKLNEYLSRGELVIFNEEKHETKIAKEVFKKKEGKSIKNKDGIGTTTYTIITDKKIPHYRMNYIFIDGNTMSAIKVENMRKSLRKLLDDDVKFESVARQYSMDYNANRGGDSGWFKEKKTIPEFFKATNRPKLLANEIFEVNLPEMNWFYIVKKTFTPTNIREVLVLVEREN